MKRLMNIAVLMMALLVFGSGIAFALNYDDHVKIAPNGKGDLLIFPFYAAIDGGWDTKLWVINTSQTRSCVAKVVIRSFANSDELLDFLIYLSPTDVWVGTLTYDSVLGVVIHSEDGSMIAAFDTTGNPIWASASNPVHQPLKDPNCPGDLEEIGYVEVIESWSDVLAGGVVPVDKDKIYDAYDGLGSGAFPAVVCNILAGHMETGMPMSGLTSAIRATAFRDYYQQTKLTTLVETFLGVGANNNLAEIEAALSKDDIAMPYDNDVDGTLHFFTFPTKLTVYDSDCDYVGSPSPFFTQYADCAGCVEYTLWAYDLEEEKAGGGTPFSPPPEDVGKWCYEVNFIASTGLPFREGWLNYSSPFGFTSTTNKAGESLGYSGYPVIATSMNIGASGLSLMYGAWSDGVVTNEGTLEYYHYSDGNPQDQVCRPY